MLTDEFQSYFNNLANFFIFLEKIKISREASDKSMPSIFFRKCQSCTKL